MSDHAEAVATKMAELGELYGADVAADIATWPELTDSQKAGLSLILGAYRAAT